MELFATALSIAEALRALKTLNGARAWSQHPQHSHCWIAEALRALKTLNGTPT